MYRLFQTKSSKALKSRRWSGSLCPWPVRPASPTPAGTSRSTTSPSSRLTTRWSWIRCSLPTSTTRIVPDQPGQHVDFLSVVTAKLLVTDDAQGVVACMCVRADLEPFSAKPTPRDHAFLKLLPKNGWPNGRGARRPEQEFCFGPEHARPRHDPGQAHQRVRPAAVMTFVGFGSGLHGWAITLKHFAEMWTAMF